MVERSGATRLVEIMGMDDIALRRYLLGDASFSEQEEIDLWLMSSEEAYDQLEAAEDDLIDEFLGGRLEGRDLTQFNDHFLVAPERQRKLQFSRSFRRAVDAATPQSVLVDTSTRGASTFGARLLDTLRYRPVLAYAGTVLILLMFMGGSWSLVRVVQLQQTLRSTTVQLVDTGRERDGLKRQLNETQTAARTLEVQLQELQSSVTVAAKPVQLPSLALSLMPGTVRSAGPQSGVQTLTLPRNPSLIEFSLTLLDDDFTLYRVSLVDSERREILSHNRLTSSTTASGKAIVLTIPGQSLAPGDYSLVLSGTSDNGSPETVGRYDFRAVRQ